MNMVIPDQGKLLWLNWMLPSDGSDQENFSVRLFQNNITPDADSVLGDFTIATFTGYASVPVDRSDFGGTFISAHVAYSDSAVVPTYTCTGGSAQTVYGWYMVATISNVVVAAQRFDSPRSMAPGATEALDPFTMALQTLH